MTHTEPIKVLPRKVLKKIQGMIAQQGLTVAFWPICKMDRDTVLTIAIGTPGSNHTGNVTQENRRRRKDERWKCDHIIFAPHMQLHSRSVKVFEGINLPLFFYLKVTWPAFPQLKEWWLYIGKQMSQYKYRPTEVSSKLTDWFIHWLPPRFIHPFKYVQGTYRVPGTGENKNK